MAFVSKRLKKQLRRDIKRVRRLAREAYRNPEVRREVPGKVARELKRRTVNLPDALVVAGVRPKPAAEVIAQQAALSTWAKSAAGRTERSEHPTLRGPEPIAHFPIPDGPINRPDLKVAVILDPFSEMAFRYEWQHIIVAREGWREQLTEAQPDLLFVESAWRGNGGEWKFTMSAADAPKQDLRDLVQWCQDQGIPTVFWNKEDPPHFERFLPTAKLFDQVFTVDADRIPAYQQALGHDRVALLPFGAQPRLHTPVLRGAGRDREVVFAGSYHADKHAERAKQMDYLLNAAMPYGLEIYSRFANEADPKHQFPAPLDTRIVGSLPYEEMLGAYTAYKVFLNVNSVTESPTMCARRLFELSAAQTPVLSAPAASIEPFFDATIPVVSDEESADTTLKALLGNKEYRDRLALRAHRRVFDEHLYSHRADTVLRSVGLPTHTPDQSISAIVPTMRPHELRNVMEFIGTQTHRDVELVLVAHGFSPDREELARLAEEYAVPGWQVVEADSELTLGACMNLGVEASSGRYVAKMDDDNYYAPDYLKDLVRAFDYTDALVVGKWAHFVHLRSTNANLLRFAKWESRYCNLVQGGTILTPRQAALDLRFEDLPRRVDTTFLEKVHRDGAKVYSTDRYSFVSMRSGTPEGHTWTITDAEILARGSQLLFYGDPRAHATV